MATDMPDMPAEIQAAHDRWQRMWSHREQLLKVARRRSMSPEDAEDAVHEAMLRAAERPDLDDERLGGWLTTVTMRLCVDRYRQVNREAEVHRSPTLTTRVRCPSRRRCATGPRPGGWPCAAGSCPGARPRRSG